MNPDYSDSRIEEKEPQIYPKKIVLINTFLDYQQYLKHL